MTGLPVRSMESAPSQRIYARHTVIGEQELNPTRKNSLSWLRETESKLIDRTLAV